jgi:hypothetical protein
MRTNFKALLITSMLISAICTLAGLHRPWPIVIGVSSGMLAGRMFRKTGKLALIRTTHKNAVLREELEAQKTKRAALQSAIEASRVRRDLLHGGHEG